jgi:hypothetical protein
VLPAFITSAVSIVQGVQGIASGNAQDAERIAANERAYESAIAGDRAALAFLKQRTGDYGIASVPGYGSIGGWATDYAKNHARERYNAALQVLQIEGVAQTAGGLIQGVAQGTGNTILPGTKGELALWAGVAVVAVFVVAFVLMRRKRRA